MGDHPMKSSNKFRSRLKAAAVCGLFITVGFALAGQVPVRPPVQQSTGGDAAIDLYVVHVTTDKPIYRAGEKVYVRGVVLRADGHSPVASASRSTGSVSFEIKGP